MAGEGKPRCWLVRLREGALCRVQPYLRTLLVPGLRHQHPTSTVVNKRAEMVLSDASKADQAAAAGKSQLIIRFYDPDVCAKDALGRQLDEILAWPDSKLESSHDYIQMLFPLPEGSPYNSEVSLPVSLLVSYPGGIRHSGNQHMSKYSLADTSRVYQECNNVFNYVGSMLTICRPQSSTSK